MDSYSNINGKMICTLGGHKSHVNLILVGPSDAFDDPKGLLEGAGRMGRHLKIKSRDELPREQAAKWVRTAADPAG